MTMKWQKLLSKKSQNLFLLINKMKDLTWKKKELANQLAVDVKTVDRYLKRLNQSDLPIQVIQGKKTIRLFYDLGYNEPYLLFDFLTKSSAFRLLTDIVLKNNYQKNYSRSTQERLRTWLGEYHLSFSYKQKKIFGSERKMRYLLFCFLKDFPHYFMDGQDQAFSEFFIDVLKRRNQLASAEVLGNRGSMFYETFPELLFREELTLPKQVKNYLCILRLSCNIITEKKWTRLEKTKEYQRLLILTEKLDSFFWLTSDYEHSNKTKLTRVLYQEWLRYSIGIQDRLSKEEIETYKRKIETYPNAKDKLLQFQLALHQGISAQDTDWGWHLLKMLQERGYLQVQPPELKIVFFFRFDFEEARRLAALLDKTLSPRNRVSIHVCTRTKPPLYAHLVITDHFSPLHQRKEQKTYFYHAELGIDYFLSDIDRWLRKSENKHF